MLRESIVCTLAACIAMQGVMGQVVELAREALPPVYIKVRAVDPFGVVLIPSEVTLDGISVPTAASERYFKVSQGRHTIAITAKGFAKVSETLEVSEATQQVVLCLEVGALSDLSTNPVSKVLNGSPRGGASCNELVVMPLHCALSRKPTTHTFAAGKFAFSDLKPGSYVLVVLSGTRVCGLTTVNIPNLPKQPIVLKLVEP